MPDILLSNSYFLDLDEHEKTIMKPYAPLGPMSISSFLKREGVDVHLHDTTFTDLNDYRALVERVSGASDPRAWLRTHYAHHWWTSLIHPIARKYTARLQATAAAHECREGCDCTYCRCVREAAGASTDDGAAGVEGARRDEHHAAVAQTGAGGEATSCH